ncbi:MAG TPA: hypothetical protein VHZ03_07295 [Trebonia sp.]|jgi:hypothetical protein|nr:hypothetical protein [Trebonia sp.]
MSVSSRTPVPGPPTAATGSSSAPESAPGGRDPAGLLLARLSVAPTLIAAAFLLAGFPLLVLGWYRPAPVIVLTVIVAAVIVPLGLGRLPGLRPGRAASVDARFWAQPGDSGEPDARRTPWWPVVSVLVIAVAFFAFNAVYHSQFLIISRDPAAYMQFATWIAGHGSLPISTSLAAFGGAKGITFGGFAMYQVGNTVVPQFMAGQPMALAVGFWLGGVNAALLLAPLFGALTVVVFGGLVGRLVGARWAPLAALVYAVSEPLMFTSRSTYSEPLATIVFLGGLSLVIDSLRTGQGAAALSVASGSGGVLSGLRARVAGWDSARVLALLGGLGLGVSLLVRIDSPADVLPIIPYLGLMLLRRQRQAVPIIIGMAIGWVWGWYDAIFVSFEYVFGKSPAGNRDSSLPLVGLIAVVLIVTVAAYRWLRRRMRVAGGLPQVGEHWYLPRWLPVFLVILPFVVLAGFAVRGHDVKEDYSLLTLHWVYWYLGGPGIALAAIGAAFLCYGCVRGRYPAWALPLMIFSWSIVFFLYRPGITPDQPWASRRLVPVVLPGFILLASWAMAWACGKLRRGEVPGASRLGALATWLTGSRRGLTAAGVASVCAVLLIVPTALGARGTALKRTYTNEVAAIYGLCAQIPSNASVVIIDGPMADRWDETIRGMCDVPVARFPDNKNVYKDPAARPVLVNNAIASIERIGRRPVLIAGTQAELATFASDGTITHVVNVEYTMDGKYNTSKPYNISKKEHLNAWMWEPTR